MKSFYLTLIVLPTVALIGISDYLLGKSQMAQPTEGFYKLLILDPLQEGKSKLTEVRYDGRHQNNEIFVRITDNNNSQGVFVESMLTQNSLHSFAENNKINLDNYKDQNILIAFGESTTFGFPLEQSLTFSENLNFRLKSVNEKLTVLNAGLPGLQTLKIVDFAHKTISQNKPQWAHLMVGNNMFIGWSHPIDKPNSVRARILKAFEPSFYWKWLVLKTIKIQQSFYFDELFKNNYLNARSAIELAKDEVLIDWPQTKKQILEEFTKRLIDLSLESQKSGTRLILTTIPINYKMTPGLKGPQLITNQKNSFSETRKNLLNVIELIEADQLSKAENLILSELKINSDQSIQNYIYAQILEKKGEHRDSREKYKLSRELMMGNLSSISSINKIIREIALKFDLPLIDVEKLFDEYYDRLGVTYNNDLLIDDCHPTALGHKMIADEMFKVVQKSSYKNH